MSDLPNRWSDFLRRVYNARGPFRANGLTDVFPVVNLLEEAGEYAAMRDEYLLSVYANSPAGGAGQYSRIFFGPASVNRGLCITKVAASSSATVGRVSMYTTKSSAWGTFLTASMHDGAAPQQVIGQAIDNIVNAPSVTAPMAWSLYRGLHGTPAFNDNVRLIVEPGWAAVFHSETANEALEINVYGYLYPLNGGEEGSA